MSEHEVSHVCPHCGSSDVPTLIVNRAASAGGGMSWRCHTCKGEWSDGQIRLRRAS
jgi:formate dehydrogenase maturation protein FdhE